MTRLTNVLHSQTFLVVSHTHCSQSENLQLFVKLNSFDRNSGNYGDFWKLIAELQKRDNPKYLFSHCLPWEYANLCATLIKANEKVTKNSHEDLPFDIKYVYAWRHVCFISSFPVKKHVYVRLSTYAVFGKTAFSWACI